MSRSDQAYLDACACEKPELDESGEVADDCEQCRSGSPCYNLEGFISGDYELQSEELNYCACGIEIDKDDDKCGNC